jgi:hypothetical protein
LQQQRENAVTPQQLSDKVRQMVTLFNENLANALTVVAPTFNKNAILDAVYTNCGCTDLLDGTRV